MGIRPRRAELLRIQLESHVRQALAPPKRTVQYVEPGPAASGEAKRVVFADSRLLSFPLPARCSRLPGSDDDLPCGRVHSDVLALKVCVSPLPQLCGIWSSLANLTWLGSWRNQQTRTCKAMSRTASRRHISTTTTLSTCRLRPSCSASPSHASTVPTFSCETGHRFFVRLLAPD